MMGKVWLEKVKSKTAGLMFFVLLSGGCSSPKNLTQETNSPPKKPRLIPIQPKTVEVFNGKLTFLEMKMPLEDGVYDLSCLGVSPDSKENTVKMLVSQRQAQVYYVEDYYSEETQRTCFLADKRIVLNVEIKQFPYKEERLRVAKSKVVLSLENQKRVEKEWLLTRDLYKTSAKSFLFDEPFRLPLYSKVTSDFGKRRVFNDLKKTSHLGTDFRAAVGVKIPAANRGRVVFTGNLFYTGNVVIIDHGMDIFSLYAHLSKIEVQTGEMVLKGQIIGRAGKTGRVSGPHLHWGVKIAGKAADGKSLVDASKQQFGLPL